MRIGLVGTDSSHAEQFLQFVNHDQRYPGARIVAVAAGEQKRMTVLSRYYDVPVTTAEFHSLVPMVDAVIVGDRDGALHLPHATPFLEAGLPVFIDKPLSLSLNDSTALCDLAQSTGARVTSASALRWQHAMEAFRSFRAEPARSLELEVTGTFYPKSEYGGTFFYGIHSVEMALELVGPSFRDVSVGRADDRTVLVRFTGDAAEVLLRLVTPDPDASSWFGIEARSGDRMIRGQIALPDDYMAPVLERFMAMVASGIVPLSREELLAPIALLTEIDAQLQRL